FDSPVAPHRRTVPATMSTSLMLLRRVWPLGHDPRKALTSYRREVDVRPGYVVLVRHLVEPVLVVRRDPHAIAPVRHVRDVDRLPREHERVGVLPARREAHTDVVVSQPATRPGDVVGGLRPLRRDLLQVVVVAANYLGIAPRRG